MDPTLKPDSRCCTSKGGQHVIFYRLWSLHYCSQNNNDGTGPGIKDRVHGAVREFCPIKLFPRSTRMKRASDEDLADKDVMEELPGVMSKMSDDRFGSDWRFV